MTVSENILFALAKLMHRRNAGQSDEMAAALVDDESYAEYRMDCRQVVLDAAQQHEVPCVGRDILDLGCYDGAISHTYKDVGARSVLGVDIDESAVRRAQQQYSSDSVEFRVCNTKRLPVDDASVDTIFCYDVFEHVEHPGPILEECFRVLRPGGKMLVGTWGWYHPYAPHLWSTMPVPWAHVMFSERTLLRTCRRVFYSDWYVPNMHDRDENGEKKRDKFDYETIPKDYLNKFLIRDFERTFRNSPFDFRIHSERFSSRWAAWTTPFLKVPLLREFFTAYIWVVLERPATASADGGKMKQHLQPPKQLACH